MHLSAFYLQVIGHSSVQLIIKNYNNIAKQLYLIDGVLLCENLHIRVPTDKTYSCYIYKNIHTHMILINVLHLYTTIDIIWLIKILRK